MRMKFVAALVGCVFLSTETIAQVTEVPNPQLPDIAVVTVGPYGNPIIIYNPILCRQVGFYLCEFYRMHEYGHIAMGHTIVPLFPNVKEAQADCWAAQNASRGAVQAAIQWFMSGGGATPQHGSGPERAQRVMQCAGQ
jgi:hypothetical protein